MWKLTEEQHTLTHLTIEIDVSSLEANRIIRNEPSKLRIVQAGTVVEEGSQRITFAAGVAVSGLANLKLSKPALASYARILVSD